ncbi:MAG: MBL fold metallo-hydrolase [Acidobacteria bacterium]|nr:MBL fold metallo-hydrolase [Acidobacteriota bacterium]
MIIETFPVGLLQCNCTILGDETTREAIVIDPGDNYEEILKRLAKHGLTVKQVVCTHTHIDHVGAIAELQERSNTPASIHEADLFLYEKLDVQAQWIGIRTPKRVTIDRFVRDGDAVACTGVELGVIHTPGHTPGSISFHLAGDRNILFTGDTLFEQSIGRTDLWGGSFPEIIRSINEKLLTFDDETLVISGHGRSTTIGRERRYNPFLR